MNLHSNYSVKTISFIFDGCVVFTGHPVYVNIIFFSYIYIYTRKKNVMYFCFISTAEIRGI